MFGGFGHFKTTSRPPLGSTGVDCGALWHLKTPSRPLRTHLWARQGSILVHFDTSRPPRDHYKPTTGLDRGRFWCTLSPQDHLDAPKTSQNQPEPASTRPGRAATLIRHLRHLQRYDITIFTTLRQDDITPLRRYGMCDDITTLRRYDMRNVTIIRHYEIATLRHFTTLRHLRYYGDTTRLRHLRRHYDNYDITPLRVW